MRKWKVSPAALVGLLGLVLLVIGLWLWFEFGVALTVAGGLMVVASWLTDETEPGGDE